MAAPAAIAFKLAGPKPELKAAAAANDQIGMGFIGVGIRGSFHLDTFKAIPGVRPIMAADCYDGHLAWAKETTEGKIETTRDYHELLNRKDIDAVVISSPDHWHARMVLDALAAGKHVYVEKPMTYTIAEGKQVVDAAKKIGQAGDGWQPEQDLGTDGEGARGGEVRRPWKAQHGTSGDVSQYPGGRLGVPGPRGRLAADYRLGALAGSGAQARVRSEAILPLALLVGILGRRGDGSVGARVDHHARNHGRQGTYIGRCAGRHLPLRRRPHVPGPSDRRLRISRIHPGDHRESRQFKPRRRGGLSSWAPRAL